MKFNWKTFLLYASLIIVGGGLIFILVKTVQGKNTGFETKTLWDWMDLFIIPLVLAIGAFFLDRSEKKLEREIATDRQQEAALQSYLDRMTDLLLEKKLLTTKDKEVRDVARTRTVSIMRVLDTKRNSLVIQFLREAKLITDENSLFHDATMSGMNLKNLDLKNVYLQRANLQSAQLQGADLRRAQLMGVNLQDADLQDANLQGAYLMNANLRGANLQHADLQRVPLDGAALNNADLKDANLRHAHLWDASLEDANLIGAILWDAVLHGSYLRGAIITDEQLAQAKSLEGATMPDGTIHD